MLAIRIEDNIIEAIDNAAQLHHTTRSGIVRQAIMRYLEDDEDFQLAERSKKDTTSTKSLSEIRKSLGLDR